MVLGIDFAQNPDSPSISMQQEVEPDDSLPRHSFVPVDSFQLNTEMGIHRNDTFFFAYDSLLSTTDAIVDLPPLANDSITKDSSVNDSLSNDIIDSNRHKITGTQSIADRDLDTTRSTVSRINRHKFDLETAVTFSAKDSLIM